VPKLDPRQSFEDICGILDAQGRGDNRKARCPAHDDQKESLSVSFKDNRPWVNCLAGCDWGSLKSALTARGVSLLVFRSRIESPDQDHSEHPLGDPVQVYPYRDEYGTEVCLKARYEPKEFRFVKRMGRDRYRVTGLNGLPNMLYRLPELLQGIADGRTVWVVEGEKDVDRLVGLGEVATCSRDGAGSWDPAFSLLFRGAQAVRIVQDRDSSGDQYASDVFDSLRGVAEDVQILIPNLKQPHADLSDHLDVGYTLDQLCKVPSPVDHELLRMAAQELQRLQARELAAEQHARHLDQLALHNGSILDDSANTDGWDSDDPEILPELLVSESGVPLFYAQGVHWIAGEPGAGKSWVGLLQAKQLLEKGERVTILDYEGSWREIKSRLRQIGVTADQALLLSYIRVTRRLFPHDVASLIENGSAFYLIDGATNAIDAQGYTGGGREEDSIAKWNNEVLRPLSENACVQVVDHVTKDADSRGLWAIGSQHKKAVVTGTAYMVQKDVSFGRGRAGRSVLVLAKDRNGGTPWAEGQRAAELHLDASGDLTRLWLSTDIEAPATTHTTVIQDLVGEPKPDAFVALCTIVQELGQGSGATKAEIKSLAIQDRKVMSAATFARHWRDLDAMGWLDQGTTKSKFIWDGPDSAHDCYDKHKRWLGKHSRRRVG
jgi:hypothetical protein